VASIQVVAAAIFFSIIVWWAIIIAISPGAIIYVEVSTDPKDDFIRCDAMLKRQNANIA
jgi:hypothetical protein